jgi:tetratricopeptide (TPR) repeat protein
MRAEFQKAGSSGRTSRAFSPGWVAQIRPVTSLVVIALALSSCSKSQPEAGGAAPQTVGQHLAQPVPQKDASVQAEQMTGDVKPYNSAQVARPLKEAHADLVDKKYAAAISKLTAAEGIEGETPYDRHFINDLLAYAYVKTYDYADAARTWEAEIDDGFTVGPDLERKVRGLSELHYQLKNYDKAAEFGERAIKGGYGDESSQTVVGQAYYLKGDWKDTRDFEDALVTAEINQGETPRKIFLQLLYSACLKLQDKACATRALERIKRYYPGAPPMAPSGPLLAFFFAPPESPEGQGLPTTK